MAAPFFKHWFCSALHMNSFCSCCILFVGPTCPFSWGLCRHLLVCAGLTPFDSLHTWLAVGVGSFYNRVWRHLKSSNLKICVQRSRRGHSSQLPSRVHQWTSGCLCWKTLLIISRSLLMIFTSPNIPVCRLYCFTVVMNPVCTNYSKYSTFYCLLFTSLCQLASCQDGGKKQHIALYQHIT